MVCYALRIMDSIFIRTDQGPIGELFTNKLLGIALLTIALSYLRMKWTDICFKWEQLPRGILRGLAIGKTAYITAFVVGIAIAAIQGKPPSLQFYVTNYYMMGNSVLGMGVLYIIICIKSTPIMRITIAQVIILTIVLIRYFSWKRQMECKV